MSQHSLLEINHDMVPRDAAGQRRWTEGLLEYIRAGVERYLPEDVSLRHRRHHSEPDPLRQMPEPLRVPLKCGCCGAHWIADVGFPYRLGTADSLQEICGDGCVACDAPAADVQLDHG